MSKNIKIYAKTIRKVSTTEYRCQLVYQKCDIFEFDDDKFNWRFTWSLEDRELKFWYWFEIFQYVWGHQVGFLDSFVPSRN